MTRDEIRALLALAAAMESRGWAPTGIDVDAWTLVLADVTDFDDARDAIVNHYRESRYRITPAEVRTGAHAIARARIGRARAQQLALPPAGPRRTIPDWFRDRVVAALPHRGAPAGDEPLTFGQAMHDLAAHLEQTADTTGGPT